MWLLVWFVVVRICDIVFIVFDEFSVFFYSLGWNSVSVFFSLVFVVIWVVWKVLVV